MPQRVRCAAANLPPSRLRGDCVGVSAATPIQFDIPGESAIASTSDNVDPPRPFQFTLGCLLFVMTGAAVLAWLWPRDFTPRGHLILGSWVTMAVGFWSAASSAASAHVQFSSKYVLFDRRRRGGVFLLSCLAGMAPTAGLVMFWRVFGGGGSNVAQYAAGGGMDLWQEWFYGWLPLFFGCSASVVVYVLTFPCYVRPLCDPRLFVMRLLGLAHALFATWIVMRLAPDA